LLFYFRKDALDKSAVTTPGSVRAEDQQHRNVLTRQDTICVFTAPSTVSWTGGGRREVRIAGVVSVDPHGTSADGGACEDVVMFA
jgi:hypothetical protein